MIMANLDILTELDSNGPPCHTVSVPEMCNSYITNKYNIKVLTMNIRSVQQNFDQFLVIFKRLNLSIDVIVLSECWIHENSVIPQLDGYLSYRTFKYINRAGGVIAFVKSCLLPDVTEPQFEEANCLQIKLGSTLTLLAIYRSPSFINITPFINSLITRVNSVKSSSRVVMAGDININISPDNDSESSSRYLCTLAELDLVPTVIKPTRLNSCLDHINISSRCCSESVVCRSGVTDHDLVIAGLKIKNPAKKDSKRLITRVDLNAVEAALSKVDWSGVVNSNALGDATSSFTHEIATVFKKYSSDVRVSRSKTVLKPWMTPGLIRCSKHKDKLHAKVRSNPDNETIKNIFTRYRNFYIDLIRKLKLKYESMELQQNKNNPKKLWKAIKTITSTAKVNEKSNALLQIKNTGTEALNHCNEYFTQIGKSLAEKTLSQINETQNTLAAGVSLQNKPLHSFFLEPTNVVEVENIIMSLKDDSAPGLDGITNKMLKKIKKYIVVPLTAIYNLSLSEGVFPNEWKMASVTPIHKSGDRADPSNYRPISLLNAFSKILEKIVNRRLVKFAEKNNLLCDRQFGFRQNKSTEGAVSLLASLVSEHLDSKKACVGVFLDLAKAFDTVSVPILVRKLELLGIRGVANKWFESYLSGRSQSLKIDNVRSKSTHIEFGVPQGSILGPTLFILYVNDIMTTKLTNADIICYADDTAIIFHESTWSKVADRVEQGMKMINAWLQKNLLTLNMNKTKFLCFHKSVKTSPTFTELKIHCCDSQVAQQCDCKSICRSPTIKYLGLLIDEKLSFKDHISTTSARVRKLIYMFKNLRSVADPDLLKYIYTSLCQSIISYCIVVWGGASTSNMIPLERAQRSVLKVMLKKPIRFPTKDLYKESKIISVRGLFILRVAMHVHRRVITSTEYDSMLKKRVFKLPLPNIQSNLARKSSSFLHPYIYNKIQSSCCIKNCTIPQLKNKITTWIGSLSYDELEAFLRALR